MPRSLAIRAWRLDWRHAVARVDQQNGEVGRGRAGRHVAVIARGRACRQMNFAAPWRNSDTRRRQMPCSRSAFKPSVNNEKSIGPALRFFDAFSTS